MTPHYDEGRCFTGFTTKFPRENTKWIRKMIWSFWQELWRLRLHRCLRRYLSHTTRDLAAQQKCLTSLVESINFTMLGINGRKYNVNISARCWCRDASTVNEVIWLESNSRRGSDCAQEYAYRYNTSSRYAMFVRNLREIRGVCF